MSCNKACIYFPRYKAVIQYCTAQEFKSRSGPVAGYTALWPGLMVTAHREVPMVHHCEVHGLIFKQQQAYLKRHFKFEQMQTLAFSERSFMICLVICLFVKKKKKNSEIVLSACGKFGG